MIVNIGVSIAIYLISQSINNFIFVYFPSLNFNNTHSNDDYFDYDNLDDDDNHNDSYNLDIYKIIVLLNTIHFYYVFILISLTCNLRVGLVIKTIIYQISISIIIVSSQLIIYYSYFNNINNNSQNILFLKQNNLWSILNLCYLASYNTVLLINYYLIKIYNKPSIILSEY